MKKVFVLTYLSSTYDNIYVEPQAFGTIEEAREALKKEKDAALEEHPKFTIEKDFDDEFIIRNSDYTFFVEIKITECVMD